MTTAFLVVKVWSLTDRCAKLVKFRLFLFCPLLELIGTVASSRIMKTKVHFVSALCHKFLRCSSMLTWLLRCRSSPQLEIANYLITHSGEKSFLSASRRSVPDIRQMPLIVVIIIAISERYDHAVKSSIQRRLRSC